MPGYYRVYGLVLKSAIPLSCPEQAATGPVATELAEGSADFFAEVCASAGVKHDETRPFSHAAFPDGSIYLRWASLFEFLIAAQGRRITCRGLNGASMEAFHTYLINQVLSFALLERKIEPFHSTVAVVNGRAVAFCGDSGYGKSSLGAAFLQAGHTLLTDDLLVLTEKERRFLAHPGPPRVKLFPEVARALLGKDVSGTPMNPSTPKLIIPLTTEQSSHNAVPLHAVYILRPSTKGRPRNRVTIRSLSPRRACLDLIANTFNCVNVKPDRLTRQFHLAARLATAVPVKSLSYPRDLGRLPTVVQAVLADLSR